VKGMFNGGLRGAVYAGGNAFLTDRTSDGTIGKNALRLLAQNPGNEQTWTCVPPGSGVRIGIDRDGDGRRDRDELDAGTDPADPASFSGAPEIVTVRATKLVLKDGFAKSDPRTRKVTFKSSTRSDAPPH